MKQDVLIYLFGAGPSFEVASEFARIPVPGEHVFLWLTPDERAKLGEEYGRDGSAVVGRVRHGVLIGSQPDDHAYVAELFVEVVRDRDWQLLLADCNASDEFR